MTLTKRLGATLAALTLGVVGAVVAAPNPALAASSDCFSGKFCMWDDAEYSGALYMYSPTTSCTSVVSQNNRATAVYNRTSRTVRMYDSSNCSGSYFIVGTGSMDWNLSLEGWNDRVSSFKQV